MITTKDKVSALYAAFFNRAPDKAGFDAWVLKLDNGTSTLEDIAEGFAAHEMFTATYGSLSNAEFVSAVYQNMTGSLGDKEGMASYTASLDSGAFPTRASMVASFVQTVMTVDLNNGFDYLTPIQKEQAQARQDQLINKTIVSQDFMDKLQDYTNPTTTDLATDPAYLASIKILSEVTHEASTVQSAKDTLSILQEHKPTSMQLLNNITAITPTSIYEQVSPKISSITISDGNYTPSSIADITLTFAQDITVSNTDSKLKLQIGTYEKYASYASKTHNSITYKYQVEDGISDKEQTIIIPKDALQLNQTIIKNQENYEAITTNEETTNPNAIVIDTTPPLITIDSAHYMSNTDKLTLNGKGFLTILEQNEDTTTDVTTRFDFTKLLWDIDADEADPNTTQVAFTAPDIKLAKVLSDTQLYIVFNPTLTTIETATSYGNTLVMDTIDIDTGFTQDKAGNISTSTSQNNILLAIDTVFQGTTANDTITGTTNTDTIKSKEGNDIIYAKEGNDIIDAGAGDDTIVGGLGIDTMTGSTGVDTFVFSLKDMDTIISFNTVEGIDTITDLDTSDKLDLDITVQTTNTQVSGTINKATFIQDINTLVNVNTNGFDTTTTDDISATIIKATSGDLKDKTYLAVDADKNNTFNENDFIIDITGTTINNLTTDMFI